MKQNAEDRPALTYKQLDAMLSLAPKERLAAIMGHAPEIDTTIATKAMGALRYHNIWVVPHQNIFGPEAEAYWAMPRLGLIEEIGCMADPQSYYRPSRRADQALLAMDRMIGRGWSFHPTFGGLDYSQVEARHYGKDLFYQALVWAGSADRHVIALSAAIAVACLLEEESPED